MNKKLFNMKDVTQSPLYKDIAMWVGIGVAIWFTVTFTRFVQLKEKELGLSKPSEPSKS